MNIGREKPHMIKDLVPFLSLDSHLGEIEVMGLTADSRKIEVGDCFLAFPGHQQDGRNFLPAAASAGASCALIEADSLNVSLPEDLAVIPVTQLKYHLPEIAKRFFDDPSQQLSVVAITGTNGKTSVSHLIAGAYQKLGMVSGVMGTLGNGLYGELQPTLNTTSDIVESTRVLWDLLNQGAEVIAMEASSHGLVQGRLEGLNIEVALVTNITRDHLDYHGSMAAYRDAKALLVQHPGVSHVVLNVDDAVVASFADLVPPEAELWTYSLQTGSKATVVAEAYELAATGIRLVAKSGDKTAEIHSSLLAEFNVSNLLAALTALLAKGCDFQRACKALSAVDPVPGRMEIISNHVAAPLVVVDFAHTPDALEKVLRALRQHCSGRLWCVFGCGGNRDQGKRPIMAKLVSTLADEAIFTADNPRDEKLSQILKDMIKGVPLDTPFQVIEKREMAVEFALTNAATNDIVLLAGKGHESYQEIGGVRYPYSDIEVSKAVLSRIYLKEGDQA